MIFDTVENIKNYQGLGRVYQALSYLAKTDFTTLPLGKYEVDGENIYYIVQEYQTAKDKEVEAHKNYIDIQLLLSGEEMIGVAPLSTPKTLTREVPEKDCYFYKAQTRPILMQPNTFWVLFPTDLHQPGMAVNAPTHCRKVVFKVKYDTPHKQR